MAEEEKKENILDIMREIDAVGDGDKTVLNARVEKMEREIVESPKNWIEPVDPIMSDAEKIAAGDDPETMVTSASEAVNDAVARGFSPLDVKVAEHGSVIASRQTSGNANAPRISDFYIIDTTMAPEDFLKLINEEVLGNYDVQDTQGAAEFGIMVMRHVHGLPQPGAVLPANADGFGPSPLAKVKPMLIVKLDAGPWPWYDSASIAIMASIVRRTSRRAWRCAWAIDKQWSWVEHWRYDSKTHDGKITETIDGPANAAVTAKARERWGIDVRSAFDELMKNAQWEALRQWLLLPEPRPTRHSVRVSFLAGNLLIQEEDPKWIVPGWAEKFPGRKPEDGPLHLQAYYVAQASKTRAIPKEERVQSFWTEPPLLGT